MAEGPSVRINPSSFEDGRGSRPSGFSATNRPSGGVTTPDSDRFRTSDISMGQSFIRSGAVPLRNASTSGFGGWGFLNYVSDAPAHKTWGTVTAGGPEWNDSLVLSETHYHHGDHHHNHHQRHIHHFHDLHLLGSAEEILDLRGAPPVATHIIPGEGGPQMRLRPDVIGRQAFEAGAEQYFGSLSARFDAISRVSGRATSPQHMLPTEAAGAYNASFQAPGDISKH